MHVGCGLMKLHKQVWPNFVPRVTCPSCQLLFWRSEGLESKDWMNAGDSDLDAPKGLYTVYKISGRL